jgi:hypothetical protein
MGLARAVRAVGGTEYRYASFCKELRLLIHHISAHRPRSIRQHVLVAMNGTTFANRWGSANRLPWSR